VTRRTDREKRRDTLLAWWGAIATLLVLAWQIGELQLWVLPVLTWVLYELCYCPTTCGVETVRGHPCRKRTRGRLYACAAEPSHRGLKWEAIKGLMGIRKSAAPPIRTAAQNTRPPQTTGSVAAPGPATLDPRQSAMFYLTVVATIAGVIQTIWALKG
jgi:hypothetical protein